MQDLINQLTTEDLKMQMQKLLPQYADSLYPTNRAGVACTSGAITHVWFDEAMKIMPEMFDEDFSVTPLPQTRTVHVQLGRQRGRRRTAALQSGDLKSYVYKPAVQRTTNKPSHVLQELRNCVLQGLRQAAQRMHRIARRNAAERLEYIDEVGTFSADAFDRLIPSTPRPEFLMRPDYMGPAEILKNSNFPCSAVCKDAVNTQDYGPDYNQVERRSYQSCPRDPFDGPGAQKGIRVKSSEWELCEFLHTGSTPLPLNYGYTFTAYNMNNTYDFDPRNCMERLKNRRAEMHRIGITQFVRLYNGDKRAQISSHKKLVTAFNKRHPVPEVERREKHTSYWENA